jgi:hypothetical protein
MSSKPIHNAQQFPADRSALHQLLQLAVEVELFTIPLYMSSLYSIRGMYMSSSSSQALWPGIKPNPNVSSANQYAYNAIFSVYIQEMLHLQLASNLCTAVGLTPQFPALDYTKFGTTIPCIGDLRKVKGYEDVEVRLGPLDRNQIKLFLAIEMPDWEANDDAHLRPTTPFPTDASGKPVIPSEFGSIGHLYHCIQQYFDIVYDDKTTLWEKLFTANSVQVDMFNFKSGSAQHPSREYPHFPVTIASDASAKQARKTAQEMITAILDQGEGAQANSVVPSRFVPAEQKMEKDESKGNAVVRAQWDKQSHYDRFALVASWLDMIETWPTWLASRPEAGAWTANDLLMEPNQATPAEFEAAQARALAMNDPTTPPEIDNALSHSYCNLLAAIESSWSDAKISFPAAAMQALSTRVATVWATGGSPSFTPVTPTVISNNAHACQGLDPNSPGTNSCANAVIHTCAGSNSCANQGGCGYPPSRSLPDFNSAAGNGGCGAPIPDAQIFHSTNPAISVEGVNIGASNGQSVYDTAWQVFQARFASNPAIKAAQKPKPNNLRIVLPPS